MRTVIQIFRTIAIFNGDFFDNTQRLEALSYFHEKRNPSDWSSPKYVHDGMPTRNCVGCSATD